MQGKCSSFEEVVKRVETEFICLPRQIQIYLFLQSLPFSTFEQKSSSMTEALEKLNSNILNNSNQVLSQHRNEETKVDFLRDAVTGC